MSEQIVITLITSAFTLAGVILTVLMGNKQTLYRISELEKKQDKHNSVIERMFKAEDRINILDEKIKVANHRIDDLEKKKK